MLGGIYLLKFKGTDSVYIGQSVDFERRFKEHMSSFVSRTASKKLQLAYDTYGAPSMQVLENIPSNKLDDREKYYIELYSSVNSGFNTSSGGYNNSIGVNNPQCKFSKTELIDIVNYVVENKSKSIRSIALSLNINYSTLYDLVKGKSHNWLAEELPEAHAIMIEHCKGLYSNNGKNVKNAKERGMLLPTLVSPDGAHITICGIKETVRTYKLPDNQLRKLIRGEIETYKGWTILKE